MLREAWDFAEAHHEAVLLAELVHRPAFALVAADEPHLVLGGNEALQELQEVQAEGFLVVPAGRRRRGRLSVLVDIDLI